jgi:hypothetical protein
MKVLNATEVRARAQKMESANLRGINFIDFGTSTGGALRWAQETFQKTGLGIDLDPQKVKKAIESGCRAIVADATDLDLPDAAVEFSIVSDFLEHLGTQDNARAVVESAVRVARDFVYIAYPDFDNEHKLRELGLKRYYADWSGHNLHLRSLTLAKMVADIGSDFKIFKLGEVFDSYDRSILPTSAPRNSSFYEPELHGAKIFAKFPRKIFYNRIICLILKSDRYTIDELLVKIFSSLGYMRGVRIPTTPDISQ